MTVPSGGVPTEELAEQIEKLRELLSVARDGKTQRERSDARVKITGCVPSLLSALSALQQENERLRNQLARTERVMDAAGFDPAETFSGLMAERDAARQEAERLRGQLRAVEAKCAEAEADPDESEWVLISEVRAALAAEPQRTDETEQP